MNQRTGINILDGSMTFYNVSKETMVKIHSGRINIVLIDVSYLTHSQAPLRLRFKKPRACLGPTSKPDLGNSSTLLV